MSNIVTTETWIEMAKHIHGNRYDYSKVEYINNRTPVCIICQEHGEFYQVPYSHLAGRGCPICGKIKKAKSRTSNTNKWIEKAIKVHGYKYDYTLSNYTGAVNKIDIICKKHGIFSQRACDHLSGYGCPKCGYEKVSKDLSNTKETFINNADIIYGGKYDYSKFEYINNKTPGIVICPKHGEFIVRPDNHLSGRNGCPKCTAEQSKWEKEINEFIKSVGVIIEENNRSILGNKYEIDTFIKNKNIGIEYDGLYWHSEKFRNRKYHIKKTLECKNKGIRLIHIFEDEWYYKSDIVKSRLKNILGLTDRKIYARKCEIFEIPNSLTSIFLNENHIQGNINGYFNIGLFYEGELVSVMSFGKLRKNLGSKSADGEYELLRFCNKLNTCVIGAASKMFKLFLEKFKPKKVISYCDLRWSDGNLYEKLNFKLKHISQPNYFYVVGNRRENRFNYRKDKLVTEGFDISKTEHEIMLDRGIYRIYDCGCKVYEFKN